MKVLLTGATGLIGGEITGRLIGLGHEVVAVSRRREGRRLLGTQTVYLDFRGAVLADWLGHLADIDAVVNCVGALASRCGAFRRRRHAPRSSRPARLRARRASRARRRGRPGVTGVRGAGRAPDRARPDAAPGLAEVEALIASETLVVDACRNVVRTGATAVPLASCPVLFALARTLAEAWPADAPRATLLAQAFGRATQTSRTARGCGSRSGGCASHSGPWPD